MSWPRKALRVVLASAIAACGSGARSNVAVAPMPPASAAEDADASTSDSALSAPAPVSTNMEPAREDAAAPPSGPCPAGMVFIDDSFCIDAFEASLVELTADGSEIPFPNFRSPDGKTVRAVSVKGAIPQTFISEVQASAACEQSGKRLCRWREWTKACEGTAHTTFPYGETRTKALCNDSGKNPVAAVFPELWATSLAHAKSAKSVPIKPKNKKKAAASKKKPSKGEGKPKKRSSPARSAPAPASRKPADVSSEVWTKLNDPRLGQVEGAVAPTGAHDKCVNDYGVFDMVGNVHEWVATDLSLEHGTFAGGYFLDTSINGEGCHYATRAHAHDYHDYSTGFRCCADP